MSRDKNPIAVPGALANNISVTSKGIKFVLLIFFIVVSSFLCILFFGLAQNVLKKQ